MLESGFAPALVVQDAAQVARALAAARGLPGRVLPLLSAPGAAHWLSPALFLALVARGAVLAGDPCPPHLPVLDCGDAPGHALSALRAGCPALVLRAACPGFAQLAAAAAEAGALLWPEAPPALDMAGLAATGAFAESRLRAWLRGGDSTPRLG